jgi:hypothetical protein
MIKDRHRVIAIILVLSLLGVSGASAGTGPLPSWGDIKLIEAFAFVIEMQLAILSGNALHLLMTRLRPAPTPGLLLLQAGLINPANPAATSYITVAGGAIGEIGDLGQITTTEKGIDHFSFIQENNLKWHNYSDGMTETLGGLNANYYDSDSGSIGNDPVVAGFDAVNLGVNIYRSPNSGATWNHLRTVTAQNGAGILGKIFGGERNSMAIDYMTGFNCVFYSQRSTDTTEESRVNCADESTFLFDVLITTDTTNLAGDNRSANYLAITYGGRIVGAYARRQTGTMYAFTVDRMTQRVDIFGLGSAPATGSFAFAGTNVSWDTYRGMVPLGDSTMANAWSINGAFNSSQTGPVMDSAPLGFAMTSDLTLRAVYQSNGDTYLATEGGIHSDGFGSGDASNWSGKQ